MVDFAIIKAKKPTATPNFHLSPFVWQQHESKKPVCLPKIITKNYTFSWSIF